MFSLLLFNAYWEWILRKVTENWNGGVSIGGKKISNLRYADDTTLLASSEEEIAEILQRIEEVSEEAGLRLNRAKCSLMVVNRQGVLSQQFPRIPDIRETER